MKKAELHEYIITAADECLTDCKSDNPLESLTHFEDKLDSMLRRRIGDTLEQSGRNRYTGEAQK